MAFVRDYDLWTVEVATRKERRLTADGAEGKILNGKPDWVYSEEIWSRQSIGFWWSPTAGASPTPASKRTRSLPIP